MGIREDAIYIKWYRKSSFTGVLYVILYQRGPGVGIRVSETRWAWVQGVIGSSRAVTNGTDSGSCPVIEESRAEVVVQVP